MNCKKEMPNRKNKNKNPHFEGGQTPEKMSKDKLSKSLEAETKNSTRQSPEQPDLILN